MQKYQFHGLPDITVGMTLTIPSLHVKVAILQYKFGVIMNSLFVIISNMSQIKLLINLLLVYLVTVIMF